MFIGEAPGAQEDSRGVPFMGRAGQLLDSMIDSIGMNRKNVYVANVLKCRPPENRDPVGIEVQSCEGYLHKQIELIRPKLIISLGRFAAQSLLKTSLPIGKLRGELHSYSTFEIPLVATYHPAYLLRSPLEKRKVWRDLLLAKSVLT
jgi:DNA polymerase